VRPVRDGAGPVTPRVSDLRPPRPRRRAAAARRRGGARHAVGRPGRGAHGLARGGRPLPPDSRQHDAISTRIADPSRQVDEASGAPAEAASPVGGQGGALGAVLLLLWKFGRARSCSRRASSSSPASPRSTFFSDAPLALRVLDGVRVEIRARHRGLDLRSRDGARRHAASLRDPRQRADVHPRVRRHDPESLLPQGRRRRRSRRPGGADVGAGRRAGLSRHLPVDRPAGVGGAGAGGRMDQPLQSPPRLAARWRACVPGADAAAAVGGGGRHRRRVGGIDRRSPRAAAARRDAGGVGRPARRTGRLEALVEYGGLVIVLTALTRIPVSVEALVAGR
jgi:hypothetical protein